MADSLLINGKPTLIRMPRMQTLLEVLRYDVGLTGTKQGCDKGDCGACTVLIDGVPTLSCCTLAQMVPTSASVVTIEGLQNGSELSVVQEAFDETGALQCGFCQSGMMLSAHALLTLNASPTATEIRAALSGHLCRCTGYVQIVDAVHLAAQKLAARNFQTRDVTGASADATGKVDAGSRTIAAAGKVDGVLKATGKLQYTDDLSLPSMLYCKILRSPHGHARVVKIDVAKALKAAGVVAIITGADLQTKFGVLPWTRDETALATDKVRFVGDEVAAVAAHSEWAAQEALKLIEVEYEILSIALSPEESERTSAAVIHPSRHGHNVSQAVDLSFGDGASPHEGACHVVEGEYFFHGTAHAPIEPHCALATYDARDGLTLWSSTQIPHYVQRTLSDVLSLDAALIRVVQPAVGGAFGGKSDPFSHEIIVAKLAMITGQPVKILLTREETFYTHRGRHPAKMHLSLSSDKTGRLIGLDSHVILDGGAYSSFGAVTTYYAGQLMGAPCRLERYRYSARRVLTNKPPCGPKRGHGTVQPRFAFEIQLDKLARVLNCCPIELRRRNHLGAHQKMVTGHMVGANGFLECLAAVEAASDWSRRWGKLPYGHGLGIAGSMYISGTAYPIIGKDLPQSIVEVRIDRLGLVHISCGASDIGQGSDTMLMQVAVDALGIDARRVRVTTGDTRLTPVDLGAYSSRVTVMCGRACDAAARELRARLDRTAAAYLGIDQNVVTLSDELYQGAGKSVHWAEIVVLEEAGAGPLFAVGTYDTDSSNTPDYRGGAIGSSPAYSFTAHVVEVKVQPLTGEYEIINVWAAHDCGAAINVQLVQGQIDGSVYMGLAEAMMEEQSFSYGTANPALLRGPSLLDYGLPTTLDTPPIESILITPEQEQGILGAKEAGEGPLHPALPALSNAIFDAVGVRMDRLPIRSSDVLTAIRELGIDHAAD